MLATQLFQPLSAQSTGLKTATASNEQFTEIQIDQAIQNLRQIRTALAEKRQALSQLKKSLRSGNVPNEAEVAREIATLQQSIEELEIAFEGIAANGLVLRQLTNPAEEKLDWKEELIQIARPVLNSLKEATEKPRKIEELRSSIRLYQQQLEQTQRATGSLNLLIEQETTETLDQELSSVVTAWQKRQVDIERSLELVRFELDSLENEEIAVFETIGRVAKEFALGRGLTLLLAIITGIAIWLLLRLLHRLVQRWRRPVENSKHAAKMRLLMYGYHMITMVIVILGVISVFYVRGDLLLLSLTIIAIVMLLLGIWRFLPGYIVEVRLLLNIGAARQGERVIYHGVPLRIDRLNLHSELRNPELEGTIRLPLAEVAQLISRPDSNDSWFPCRPGEYLILEDGTFAQVMRQTIELVDLKTRSSLKQISTAAFLQTSPRNISREEFGVIGTFGIDYKHQPISLDEVPKRFKQGLDEAFAKSGFKDDLKDLLVEFKTAASSSLDYLIYATLQGGSASSYFTIERLIQQTCVDICNQEGWGIPFTQITLHQADKQEAEAETKSAS